jgi:hypothetical protein
MSRKSRQDRDAGSEEVCLFIETLVISGYMCLTTASAFNLSFCHDLVPHLFLNKLLER